MRITRDTLLKIAADAVARKTRQSSGVLAAYLCGSLLGDDYLMGGAADIDLVFIHADPVAPEREIVRMTDEVHLDIAHHFHRSYRDTRALRVHPWLGPTLFSCKVLFDPQHFLDFTQASVRGQFDRPDYIYERARRPAEEARNLWMSLQPVGEPRPDDINNYLRSIEYSANSLALLAGPPMTERRFLERFQSCAELVGQPGLYAGLLGLLGAPNLPPGALGVWLEEWRRAYTELPGEGLPPRMDIARLGYYQMGYHALLNGPQPLAVLWPLLRTWTEAVRYSLRGSEHYRAWEEAMSTLGLMESAFAERLVALDSYLDLVEETLESWARSNGAWES